MKVLAFIFLLYSTIVSAQKQDKNYFLARTQSKLTMLGNAVGDDKIGGAKAGYLDSGVLLTIVDSINNMYKVLLSQNHTTYVNPSDVKVENNTIKSPIYLTNSLIVKGDENFDYVNINVSERLPYKSWMEVNPSKIIVELYGVQSNTNWITQLRSVKEIKDVYSNQVEDDVIRITIELKNKQHWGYSINYNKNILSIRVRRQPSPLNVKALKIAVDAGHGGGDNGAVGSTQNVLEKHFTLRFANELEKYLKNMGATIYMTRNADTTISTEDRVLMLQQTLPDLLISLHFNSSANRNVKGASTYYKHSGFRSITKAVLNKLLELPLTEFGNIGDFNSSIITATDFPSCLIEVAFITNPGDEKKITDARFQKEVAKKIYQGIKDWLKLAKE